MSIEQIYNAFLESTRIITDSRALREGDFFVALKGANFDGNDFAGQALQQGAAYVLADNPEKAPSDVRCFVVDDALETLQQMATLHRQKLDLPILAITGSNGKTTTKILIARVLAEKYKVGATQGNLNNHIGVPLTLLSFTKETDVGIVEMGANHEGEIHALCEITKPDYGLITNIGKAHLEGFGSFEGVVRAKSELYNYLNNHNGEIFINADNEILLGLLEEQEVIAYGEGDDNHYKGLLLETNPFLTVQWRHNSPLGYMSDDWSEQDRRIKTHLSGAYNFENVLAAISIGADFGVPEKAIKHAIESYVPQDNRSEWLQTAHNKVLLDAYNANPTSMNAAISNFGRIQARRKVMILGDMLELGSYAKSEHRQLLQGLLKKDYASIYLVGEHFKQHAEEFAMPAFDNVEQLITHLKHNPIKNALILVKGSRGIQLEKVKEAL